MTQNSAAGAHPRRSGIMRTLAAGLVATVLAGTAACGGDSTGPSGGPAGTYALRQLDDENLPGVVHHGPWFDGVNGRFYNQLIVSITGGRIELDRDDRFTLTFDVTLEGDGQTGSGEAVISGDYTIDGSEILLERDGDGAAAIGTLRNGTITLELDFMDKGTFNEFTFRR